MTGIVNAGDGYYAITSPTALSVAVANLTPALGVTPIPSLDTLLLIDTTGKPHAFTFPAGKLVAGKTTITFSGTVGDFVQLKLIQGLVYVLASRGVTLT